MIRLSEFQFCLDTKTAGWNCPMTRWDDEVQEIAASNEVEF